MGGLSPMIPGQGAQSSGGVFMTPSRPAAPVASAVAAALGGSDPLPLAPSPATPATPATPVIPATPATSATPTTTPSAAESQKSSGWTAAESAFQLFFVCIPKAVVVGAAAVALLPIIGPYALGHWMSGGGVSFGVGSYVPRDEIKTHSGIVLGYFLCLAQVVLPADEERESKKSPFHAVTDIQQPPEPPQE